MKKLILIAVLATLPLSLPLTWADDTHHANKDKEQTPAMTAKDQQVQMEKMQEHMLTMHAQMHKIMDAKSPEERKQLMEEQIKMMQDRKQEMKGMMGGKMDADMKGK